MRNQRHHEERTGHSTPPHGVMTWGMRVGLTAGTLFLLAVVSGCVSARATYDPATGVVGLDYSRLGDIEMEAIATRAPDGTMTVSVRSVSQAAALNTAVAALAALAKTGAAVP